MGSGSTPPLIAFFSIVYFPASPLAISAAYNSHIGFAGKPLAGIDVRIASSGRHGIETSSSSGSENVVTVPLRDIAYAVDSAEIV